MLNLPRRPLSPEERLDWLRLIRTENVGPATFYKLLEIYGSAKKALDAIPDMARRGGRMATLVACPSEQAEAEIAALEKFGGQFVASCEPEYPPLLATVDDAPPVLAIAGQIHLLQRPAIAMVGARNGSLNGRKLTENLARDLAQAGYVIVSGLARGIDTSAHMASLYSGTVAALGGGIDVVYPPENAGLYADIHNAGVLVSEAPFGTQPLARHFPRRNRLIAGMAQGVIVVEAAMKSGSLITAKMALDYGREVFAVPGSPLDPRAQGTNALLRDGACLTETAEDVIRTLTGLGTKAKEPDFGLFAAEPPAPVAESEIDAARAVVLELLSPSPTPVDEIVRQCQIAPTVVWTVLLELELAGRIERQPGNTVNLIA